MKALTFCLLLAGTTFAQAGQPALAGLKRIEEKFGAEFAERVFEMTGVAGDPQPAEWRVTAHDPVEKSMLHEFWIGGRRVTDEGLNDDFYPERLPKGFFKLSRVKLDSTDAFAAAEEIAREARLGFDLINYKLHCREYSEEPVWTLTLLDKEEEIVGSVHLSAETGAALRTVWVRRAEDGRVVVQDTALGYKMKTVGANPKPPSEINTDSEPGVPRESEFGIADEEAPPPPAEPEPAAARERPAAAPTAPPADQNSTPADPNLEIPEIRKLNEAQEKAVGPKPPQ